MTAGRELDAGTLVVDIGGGSTELIPADRSRQHRRRLRADDRALRRGRRTRSRRTSRSVATRSRRRPAIGVAGTITTLAALDLGWSSTTPSACTGTSSATAAVDEQLARLASLPLEERRRLPGLEPERAPVIVAGAAILRALLRRYRLDADRGQRARPPARRRARRRRAAGAGRGRGAARARTPAADQVDRLQSAGERDSSSSSPLAALALPAASHAEPTARSRCTSSSRRSSSATASPLRGGSRPAAAGRPRRRSSARARSSRHGRTDSPRPVHDLDAPGQERHLARPHRRHHVRSGPVRHHRLAPARRSAPARRRPSSARRSSSTAKPRTAAPGDAARSSASAARSPSSRCRSGRRWSSRPTRRGSSRCAPSSAPHTRARALVAGARTLSYGSTGPDVVALRARLAELHVHVPGPSTTFGSELYDTRRRLPEGTRARRGPAPSTTRPGGRSPRTSSRRRATAAAATHIEVSKSRQILMVVDGRRDAVVPARLLRRRRDHAGRQLPRSSGRRSRRRPGSARRSSTGR